MDYVKLGASGMLVSQYVLGTLTFSGTNGFEKLGTKIDDKAGRRMIDLALDHGVNAVDTANLYSKGDAETIVGKALKGRRDKALIFSKVRSVVGDGPNGGGASRVHISAEIEKSLKRLQTDYLDLYFIHQWDGATPIGETVETMSGLVKAGKIRYWGVSNYSGWSLARTVSLAESGGFVLPVAHQIYYTPEGRHAEYELLQAGQELGVASMIWSPLGQGLFSGKVDRDHPPKKGTRQGENWPEPHVVDEELLWRVIDAVKAVAKARNVSGAQVALAWVRQRPGVDTIVLGARTDAQLEDNLASINLVLDEDEMAKIEEAGRPPAIYPFWHRSMWAFDRPTPSEKTYLEGWRKSLGVA